MKYLAMVQARCGSTRLPNKILKDICGKSALQRMLERIQRSECIDEVIVVTSIEKNNLPVLSLCAEKGIRVFVGSENDVLDRFYQAAKLLQPEYVIRLTADCPCFDAQLLDKAITMLAPETDYLGMLSETFADGLDFEIMRFSALKRSWQEANLASQREHVTQYIIHNPELFHLQDFVSSVGDFGNFRWTMDEPEDFVLIEKIYRHFLALDNEWFGYRDVLQLMQDEPELCKINNAFVRNEGLKESIQKDCIVPVFED